MSFTPQQPQHSSQAEAELMDILLAAPNSDYPWDPSDPIAADYYAATDRQFNLDDWSEAEIAQRSQAFFSQIARSCWTNSPSPEPEASTLETLIAKFGARVPQQWLEQIATNVSNLATSKLEPVDRLVRSVGDLLSNWAEEDLLVMARPYAYAMRGDGAIDNPDLVSRNLDWQQLSEVERAKLTMMIAACAIDPVRS